MPADSSAVDQEVADRLQKKIRDKALELLNRCDDASRPNSAPQSPEPARNAPTPVRSAATPADTRDGVPAPPPGFDIRTPALDAAAGSANESNSDSRSTVGVTDQLTKRLQKLAMERQKQSSSDRLRVIQSDTSSHLSSCKTFEDLKVLPQELLTALYAMGFDRPSAIQEEALPRILADPPRNLIGQAQSGAGKTAARRGLHRPDHPRPARSGQCQRLT